MVLTVFFLSHAAKTLSSKLLVPLTAASNTCHAAKEAAAWVSTWVSGKPALAARSLKVLANSVAPKLLIIGACCSKIVTAKAFLASGDLSMGPGEGK